jgi:hypothetical protein
MTHADLQEMEVGFFIKPTQFNLTISTLNSLTLHTVPVHRLFEMYSIAFLESLDP